MIVAHLGFFSQGGYSRSARPFRNNAALEVYDDFGAIGHYSRKYPRLKVVVPEAKSIQLTMVGPPRQEVVYSITAVMPKFPNEFLDN